MKRKTWLAATLLALGLLVAACGAGPPKAGRPGGTVKNLAKNADGYTDISVQQLADLLKKKDFVLVNVHVPYAGELPQTDLFVPYDQIAQNLGKLPAKEAPIVLYCRSGSMSTSAAKELASLGYTNVLEVDGGLNAWQAAGYELIKK